MLNDINAKVIGGLLESENTRLDVETYVSSALGNEIVDIFCANSRCGYSSLILGHFSYARGGSKL